MALIELLRSNPGLLTACVSILGLLVGSFLNVVALRLPRMMKQAWMRECREVLQLPARAGIKISLMSPPSACPTCGAAIKPWHNIPVLSWVLLRGRCAGCSSKISIQYPLVEAATGLLSALCAWHYGWSAQLPWALLLTWALIALTVIDLREMLLPDDITLPLLWLGLLLSLTHLFTTPQAAIVGAASGYLSLWLIFHLFKLVTGKEGMGYGDFKLFAVFGAWLGWQALPMIILLSSLVGAVVGVGLIVAQRMGREAAIPFGPYLAGAGWIAMLWGESLKMTYFRISGIG